MFALTPNQEKIALFHAPKRNVRKSLDKRPKNHPEIVRRHRIVMKPLTKNTVVVELGFYDLVKLACVKVGDTRDPGIRWLCGNHIVVFGRG